MINMYHRGCITLKSSTVNTVCQGVALHIIRSILTPLSSNPGNLNYITKVNLYPLFGIFVIRTPTVTAPFT